MTRWSGYDSDAERLPSGMKRISYDADTQTYTFRDADGSTWESAPGNRYGELRRVGAITTTTTAPSSNEQDDDNDDDEVESYFERAANAAAADDQARRVRPRFRVAVLVLVLARRLRGGRA